MLRLNVFATLGLNVAKIIDYIEKCFKQKLYKIKFPIKNSVGACFYLPKKWSWGAAKICHFLNNTLKLEIRFI